MFWGGGNKMKINYKNVRLLKSISYVCNLIKNRKIMSKKIIENWEAINETERLVQERTGDPKAGFNASSFFLGSQEGRHLMIPCMYRGLKGKKGYEEFTQSYKEMMVYAKFCPFTGKPLYDDSISSTN